MPLMALCLDDTQSPVGTQVSQVTLISELPSTTQDDKRQGSSCKIDLQVLVAEVTAEISLMS